MFLPDKCYRFDLGRLTWLGWLVFFLAIMIGIGAALAADTLLNIVLPQPPANANRPKIFPGFVGVGSAIGFFFAVKGLLQVAGVRIIRPNSKLSTKPETESLNRRAQIIIGIILLALACFLMLMSTIPEQQEYRLVRQLGAILPAFLGLTCVFTWGRPYTTRLTLGMLSLSMLAMIAHIFSSDKPDFRPAAFASLVAVMSGAYAITGRYPSSLPMSDVFGKKK